jgi:hypothetical protein
MNDSVTIYRLRQNLCWCFDRSLRLQSIKQHVSDLFRLKLQEYINMFLCFNSLITSGSTVISISIMWGSYAYYNTL